MNTLLATTTLVLLCMSHLVSGDSQTCPMPKFKSGLCPLETTVFVYIPELKACGEVTLEGCYEGGVFFATLQDCQKTCESSWVRDDNTGKLYLVLSTTTLAHDVNRDTCLLHGGILPEPRSQEENEFLNNLNTNMFVLGISDVDTEGSWVWDSDGTPVVYTNWGAGEPALGRLENCAVMMRNFYIGGAFWGDIPCSSNDVLDAQQKNLICQKNEASLITFTSTPSSIVPRFTEQLQMRCGLGYVPDVKHVVSIGITRNGEPIASISDFHAAEATADLHKITVYGDVTGVTVKQSFLLVEWSQPTLTQTGTYQCDLLVIYTDGHSGKLSASLKVKRPTLLDLVDIAFEQQEEITKHTNEITELKENVHQLGHVENGSVSFGKSETWTGVNATAGNDFTKQKDIAVTFKSPYQQPPSILLSITGLDVDNRANTRHNCSVLSKNNQGFTIRCFTWHNSQYYNVIVSWLSVPGDYQ